MKLPRSQGGVDPRVRAQMDRFVEGSLIGLGATQAAVFAGVASKSAARTGYAYAHDPYVLALFEKLSEKLTKDKICSFNALALKVKAIAWDEWSTATRDRLTALKLMVDIMGHAAPTKVSTTVNGGVLLLPVADSMEQWESQAVAAQAALQKEVEQDAT